MMRLREIAKLESVMQAGKGSDDRNMMQAVKSRDDREGDADSI